MTKKKYRFDCNICPNECFMLFYDNPNPTKKDIVKLGNYCRLAVWKLAKKKRGIKKK